MKRLLPRIRRFPLTKNAALFLVTAVLLAASYGLTLQLRHRTDSPAASPISPASQASQVPRASLASTGAGIRTRNGTLRFERIGNSARTVARDRRGTVIATFTDGARTAVLTGPSRTFAEPRTTDAKVVTKSWVRLLPKAWTRGAERSDWFRTWLRSRLGSRDPDILATAFDYIAGAPARKTAAGVTYSGAARYTPKTAGDSGRATQGKSKPRTGSDFYDYLGIPWTFPDTVTRRPEKDRARSVDSSGYVRLVYGYRSGFPLNSRDNAAGNGLQRTPDAIARGRLGLPVIPLTDRRPAVIQQLQPGDLVFFKTRELPGGRIGHIGIYLGLDIADHPRFISSRKNAGGPTMGDKGGTSRLDGDGYYAQGLRAARRL